jgi:hypothetical protein
MLAKAFKMLARLTVLHYRHPKSRLSAIGQFPKLGATTDDSFQRVASAQKVSDVRDMG